MEYSFLFHFYVRLIALVNNRYTASSLYIYVQTLLSKLFPTRAQENCILTSLL